MWASPYLQPDPQEAKVLGVSSSDGEVNIARTRPCRRSWVAAVLAGAATVAVTISLAWNPASLTAVMSGSEEKPREEALFDVGLLPVPVREFEELMLDELILDKPDDRVFRLKPGADKHSVDNTTDTLLERRTARRLSTTCSTQKQHLKALSTQHISPNSHDVLFPPSMSSIAPPGTNCGDSAAGVHEPCSKYNDWKTFQAVAQHAGKPFKVMGSPNFHDIDQGELGTCYFLSALASIAYTDPHVIDNMFVDRHKWSQNIYTTRWFVNGETISVVVDNNIPAKSYRPYFVQPSSTGEWWPVILEKSWAKMAGSFKNAEAGQWASAVMGMTGGAPIKRYGHKETSVDDLMALMSQATNAKHPMGAGTRPNCVRYGLSQHHAYSVFKVLKMAGHGTVVEVYNPWHRDNYKGQIPNEHRGDGVFRMTAAEYHDAFRSTGISHVKSSHKVSTREIQTDSSKTTAWTFDMPSSGEFSVSVRWPLKRFLEKCRFKAPRVSLAVQKHGSNVVARGQQVNHGYAMTTAKVTAGQGRYTAVAAVIFPDSNEVHEAHLVVYSTSQVTIQPSHVNAVEKLAGMLAPSQGGKACSVIFVNGYGNFLLQTSKVVNGIATYWAPNEKQFLYWTPTAEMWYATSSRKYAAVQRGEIWSFQKLKTEQLSCGCQDDKNGVGGFQNVYCDHKLKSAPPGYGNVQCTGTQHSQLVQQYCPKFCGASFCTTAAGSSPAPSPPPPPPPPAPPSARTCADKQPPGIKLNGHAVQHCSELVNHCQAAKVVEEQCCESCAEHAEAGGVSNDHQCVDHHPTNIQDQDGVEYSCSELKGHCQTSFIADRCCKTCGEADGF